MPESRAAFGAQLLRFLAAGGIAALLNFGSRFLFSRFASFELAVFLSFWVGLASAFVLNRRFVFGASRQGIAREMAWFLVVNLAALLQTWLLAVWLAGLLVPRLGAGAGEAAAHFAGIMLPIVSSYFGHRFLTFRGAEHTGTHRR